MRQQLSLKTQKSYHVTNTKVTLLATFIVTLLSSGVYTAFLLLSSINLTSKVNANSPTSIPWIDNQSECVHTGRTWSNEKCWDYEHNPLF